MDNVSVTQQHAPSTDWLCLLQALVRLLQRPDIRSVPALIGKLLADPCAAQMCLRLLYWLPRAKKAGGWVYKSARDWNAECNLSPAQVKRVHSRGYLEQVGFVRQMLKANGSPTTHYRLNEPVFLARLAAFLDLTPEQITQLVGQNAPVAQVKPTPSTGAVVPGSSGDNHPAQIAQTASPTTSITIQDSQHEILHEQQHRAVVVVETDPDRDGEIRLLDELRQMGILSNQGRQLVTAYGSERVLVVLRQTQKQARVNPAGYLIRALRDNWQFEQTSYNRRQNEPERDASIYITGKYAEFIQW